MQAPPPPTKSRSALMRYAPFIAIALVIVVIAVFLGGKKNNSSSPTTEKAGAAGGIAITYDEAKAAGTLDKSTWQTGCDATRGQVGIPVLQSAPCVPKFTGTKNGGATAPGVTGTTITIAFYVAKPDLQTDALTRAVGAYDSPEQVLQGVKDYVGIFKSVYETYGRKINLVQLKATGTATDATAARADALKAADELHAFAVIGGPTQTNAFADELTKRGVMCIGSCLIAQPATFYDKHPGLFGVGPLVEQPVEATVEFAKKQLKGKDAIYAGDPKLQKEKRKFALLTYNTPDGQFTGAWNTFETDMKAAGMPFATHASYFLDLATAAQDARGLIIKLKTSGATTVVFSGDPLMPKYFTEEATKQNYHPEWLISGTVYADTDVFARSFDQDQWKHAFGIGLVGPQSPLKQHDDYQLHQWWYGKPPPDLNTTGIIAGDVNLLFTGIQLAGPKLTVASVSDGLRKPPPPPESAGGLRPIITYGKHHLWPGTDYGGLDNINLIWWDPTARCVDETGGEGVGCYRFVDNGRRFLPTHWPTTPVNLFNPTDTITSFKSTPPELLAPTYPARTAVPEPS